MPVRSVGTLLRPVAVAVAAVVVVLAMATGAMASHSAQPQESPFDELLQLPQWKQVARQLPREAGLVRACLKGRCTSAAVLRLAAMVERGSSPDRMVQLRRVHEAVNRQTYAEDRDQFGVDDLWQSPLAFAARGGDCEDFAIAKYFVLRLLGMAPSDLRIVVLTGQDRREVHAVLLARAAGEWHVLDNREEEPRPLRSYRGWILQYGLTEAAGFRYSASGGHDPIRAPAQR
jgi:predicted transglutaminase-like cysteine proteinase